MPKAEWVLCRNERCKPRWPEAALWRRPELVHSDMTATQKPSLLLTELLQATRWTQWFSHNFHFVSTLGLLLSHISKWMNSCIRFGSIMTNPCVQFKLCLYNFRCRWFSSCLMYFLWTLGTFFFFWLLMNSVSTLAFIVDLFWLNNSSCSFNRCHTCTCACECSFWIVKHDKYRISTAWSGTRGSAEGTNSDRPMRVIRSRSVNSNSYRLIHTSDSLDGIWFARWSQNKVKPEWMKSKHRVSVNGSKSLQQVQHLVFSSRAEAATAQ